MLLIIFTLGQNNLDAFNQALHLDLSLLKLTFLNHVYNIHQQKYLLLIHLIQLKNL